MVIACNDAARASMHGLHSCGSGRQRRRVTVAAIVDRTLMVKLSLAQTSNRLDLSECELEAVPPEVLELRDLEVRVV